MTYRLCADRPDLVWRRWGRIRVAGKSAPLNVYEAFGSEDLGDPLFVTTYHSALAAFERNDFASACDLFVLANAERPGNDPPSMAYARWCETLIAGGAPAGWEPIFETHK
jgi:hypothetical protein